MNQLKTFRRIALLVLVVAGILTLAACTGSEKTPYGSISNDNIYLTYGDLKVTEKDLYDQLRMQGATTLATMVDEELFKTQITDARAKLAVGNELLVEYLDDTVNKAIHGISDMEELEKLYDDYPKLYVRNIEKYADSVYLLDNSIVIQKVIDDLLGLAQTQDNPFTGYHTLDFLLDRYAIRVAQRAFAKEQLAIDVLDKESDVYISDEDIVTYYKNNKEGQYDVDALIVRFINLNEANAALYQVGLKPDSKGFWYALPDIRIEDNLDPNYVDLDDPDYAYILDILETIDIKDKLGANLELRNKISVKDYENYYKAYVIKTDRNNGLSDVKLLPEGVKAKYIEIYNLLNPAAKIKLDTDNISIVGDDNDYTTTYTYDDLTEINTSLRSHIYSTLIAEANMADSSDTTDGKPYSSRVQTFGDSRYLVFKLADESETEDGILIEDPKNSDAKIFGTSANALAIKAEMKDDLIESKLTDAYISKSVFEFYPDEKLDIYDSIVRMFYDQNYGYDGAKTNKVGDVLAKVGDVEILVDTFYKRLESSYGINIALDMLSNQYLMASEDYTVSAADMDDYTEQFENIISQFSADNFASSGYPASLGRQNFLLAAFGSRSNKEAIDNLYVYPDLRQQYLEDYDVHFANTNVFENLAKLSKKQYDNFESITVSHLLIYFDQNGDGSPDNPTEYLDTLSVTAKQEVLDGLVDLVELIYSRVGDYKGFPEALRAISTDFNNSGRIETGSKTPPYDHTLESLWAEYRQLGFYLKFEDITSAITNKSNFVTGQGVLDEVFYDRAMEIHEMLVDDENVTYPYLDFYDAYKDTFEGINQTVLESVQSAFGYHLILATKVAKTTSAKYDGKDDKDGVYVLADDATLNAYNTATDTLSATQVKYYLLGSLSDEGVELPTNVQTAITSYLQPVLTVYQGNYMQRELIFSLLSDAEFASPTNSARLAVVRAINIRQMHGYMLSENGGVNDANYNALMGDLLAILQGKV